MFLINRNSGGKFKYAWRDLSFLGFSQRPCPGCGRQNAEFCYEDGPHSLMLEGGKAYPDLLAYTGAGEQMLILSAPAVDILLAEGISGFSAKEKVMVSDVTGEILFNAPDYFLLSVGGRIELDLAAMGLKKKKLCPQCGQFEWNRQRLYPLVLDMAAWDGSDLCRVESIPGYFVCSDRFADIVKKHGLTGFSLNKLLTPNSTLHSPLSTLL